MNALVIGGPRHGEWVDLFDGSRVWVDLMNAASHVIRKANASVTDPVTGDVREAYVVHLAVHPDIAGRPDEPQVVGNLLNAIAMNALARAHGERQDVPHEPSAEERGGSDQAT